MSCEYYLTQNLLQRNAASLVFQLNELSTAVYLYKEYDERRVNGKSFVGILSGKFLQGETIKVLIDNPDEMSRVKRIFDQFGKEINNN